MKVNLGVELDDAQRRALASIIKGKPTMKMASRDDVREFLGGIVGALAKDWPADLPAECAKLDVEMVAPAVLNGARAPYSAAEQAEAERLLAEGRHPDYVRGWIATGRAIRAQRKGS